MRMKIRMCFVRYLSVWMGVLGIACLAAISTTSVAAAAVPGQWTRISDLAPSSAGTMILLTDGTVISHNMAQTAGWMRLSPDAKGDYVNGSWSSVAPMGTARLYFASNVLPNGNVWVLGGEYVNGNPAWTNTGEIYDSVNNTWSPIANYPLANFGDDPSMLLPGGKILAGSLITRQAFLYDIENDFWSETGSKVYNDRSDEESWVQLADGRVLTYDLFQSIATGGSYAEVYNPQLGAWTSISPSDGTAGGIIPQLSSIALGYELGPLLRLQDGRIFAIGATGHTAFYTPSTNTWMPGPDIMGTLNNAPALFGADDSPGAVLPNGHVLFLADAGPTLGLFQGPTEIFDFDPATNTISEMDAPPASNLSYAAYISRLLVLPTGQVLMSDASSQVWLYTPTGSAPMKLRPRIEGVKYDGAGVFTLTGQQLNGQNAGSAYGDDAEMDENYPIIHLTDRDGNVFYARSSNWSSVQVSTGVYRETVDFTLPNGPTNGGVYKLSVSGAGIPSVTSVSVNLTALMRSAH